MTSNTPTTDAVPSSSSRLATSHTTRSWPSYLDNLRAMNKTVRYWCSAAGLFLFSTLIHLLVLSWVNTGHARSSNVDPTPLKDLLKMWDGEHYVALAQLGYVTPPQSGGDGLSIEETRFAFFPGLPALIRLLHFFGLDYIPAGVILSTVFGIILTAGILFLVDHLGGSSAAQLSAALLVLGAPMSLTFTMVYTEAPFMACSMWALYAMCRRQWFSACLWVFVSCFFRLTAIDLWLTLILVIFIYARTQWRVWACACAALAPLVVFIAYASAQTRDSGGYFGLQNKGWNSHFDFGVATWKWLRETLSSSENFGYVLSSLCIIAAIITVFSSFRRIPWPLWIFGTGIVANIVLSDGIMHSRPRLLLPAIILLLPVTLYIGKYASRRSLILAGAAWLLLGSWLGAHMLVIFEYAI
ncbi:glycosyltransferase family 39 protein [Corynebacterium sp. sy039]|uniref:glycosyltransferase family 39 protein n=1 Tax=Corynebacterium sp. sy039 TaxID=2599641 RepID=UPI0011B85E89|nr:glycosyltransferase family 39 protein [Corynebacterium sp. sy039]QDZ43382.1 glycosyltransferase family 39 protein [Corynebacterium sp. sy039]